MQIAVLRQPTFALSARAELATEAVRPSLFDTLTIESCKWSRWRRRLCCHGGEWAKLLAPLRTWRHDCAKVTLWNPPRASSGGVVRSGLPSLTGLLALHSLLLGFVYITTHTTTAEPTPVRVDVWTIISKRPVIADQECLKIAQRALFKQAL